MRELGRKSNGVSNFFAIAIADGASNPESNSIPNMASISESKLFTDPKANYKTHPIPDPIANPIANTASNAKPKYIAIPIPNIFAIHEPYLISNPDANAKSHPIPDPGADL